MAIKFFAFFFPTISTFGCFWSQWPTSLAVTSGCPMMRCGRLPSRSDVNNIKQASLWVCRYPQFGPSCFARLCPVHDVIGVAQDPGHHKSTEGVPHEVRILKSPDLAKDGRWLPCQDLTSIRGDFTSNYMSNVETLGSRSGHPQTWQGPIAYHTFALKWYMVSACRSVYLAS